MSKGLIPTSVIDEQKGGTLRQWLDRDDIVRDIGRSLSGWMDPEVFKAQIIVSLNDEKLAECTPESKYKAVLKCAALQLLPGLNQVALIPRKIKDKKGNVLRIEVDVMPQWQGYQAIMLRNPEIRDVRATLVHTKDTIVFDPVAARIASHDFDPFDEEREFKDFMDVKGGYVVVEYRDRSRPDRHHFVKKKTIMKARQCAQTGDIWGAWFEEQCLKTLWRNAYARRVVPIDPMFAQKLEELIRHEDQLLGNDPSRVVPVDPEKLVSYGPKSKPADEPPEQPKSRGERLADEFTPAESKEPEPESEAPVDESPEAEPESKEPKSKGKKQKSLVPDENEKTLYKQFLDRIAKATTNEDCTVIMDEAGEWCGHKKLTTAEYEDIIEKTNNKASTL